MEFVVILMDKKNSVQNSVSIKKKIKKRGIKSQNSKTLVSQERNDFEPVIVGFCCNECAYAAADLAGSNHLSYPTNIRIIRVPCSGQVDWIHILRAFENGADGVFVAGCLKEQCHYGEGNYKAEDRVIFLKEILDNFGFENRLNIYFISASMANEFAKVCNEITVKIKEIGPSPLKNFKREYEISENKRQLFKNMIKILSDFSTLKDMNFKIKNKGFGKIKIDSEKCLGCGACEFVCKNNALSIRLINGRYDIEHLYWKCTGCGSCKDICLNNCIELESIFDLFDFLDEKAKTMVKIDLMSCQKCGEDFLPILQSNEIERIVNGESFSSKYLQSCSKCRISDHAENFRDLTSQKRLDKLRNMNKYQPC